MANPNNDRARSVGVSGVLPIGSRRTLPIFSRAEFGGTGTDCFAEQEKNMGATLGRRRMLEYPGNPSSVPGEAKIGWRGEAALSLEHYRVLVAA